MDLSSPLNPQNQCNAYQRYRESRTADNRRYPLAIFRTHDDPARVRASVHADFDRRSHMSRQQSALAAIARLEERTTPRRVREFHPHQIRFFKCIQQGAGAMTIESTPQATKRRNRNATAPIMRKGGPHLRTEKSQRKNARTKLAQQLLSHWRDQ